MEKFDLGELLRDRDEELKLRKKTERHLTQDDIRNLVENQRQTAGEDAAGTGPAKPQEGEDEQNR